MKRMNSETVFVTEQKVENEAFSNIHLYQAIGCCLGQVVYINAFLYCFIVRGKCRCQIDINKISLHRILKFFTSQQILIAILTNSCSDILFM